MVYHTPQPEEDPPSLFSEHSISLNFINTLCAHVHVCKCVRACVCTCMHVCTRVCMHVYMRVCVCGACVLVCVHVCVHRP